MKLLAAMVLMVMLSTAANSADVYRDGETLVMKGFGGCFAVGLDNIKMAIPDKTWTPIKPLLMVAVNSRRPLTAKETQICFGDTAVPNYIWAVAPSSAGDRPVYLSKRLASGRLTKTKTGQRLAVGLPCSPDYENTYTDGYTGGKRMWRNILGSVDFIVYCAKK